jgi:poly-gamma-glutamate capsule biosynthesis protein CapA/YwtB (metallophosphatase superfamily)
MSMPTVAALAWSLLIAVGAVVSGCGSGAAPLADTGTLGGPSSANPASPGGTIPTAPTATPALADTPMPTPPTGPSPTSSVAAILRPTPSAAGLLVPLVPIVSFWSPRRATTRTAVELLLGPGHSLVRDNYSAIAVAAPDAAALAATMRVTFDDRVSVMAPADVVAAVRASPTTLGLVRPEDVTSDVRALNVDGLTLFGASRITDLDKWPVLVPSPVASSFDPSAVWTLAAGGDVNLDRNVYVSAIRKQKGVDFPWAGGTARISGSTCCGFQGNSLIVARRTGNGGAFRALLSGADIAVVNLEGPASTNFVYRKDGFAFAVDPVLLTGLRNAGIDAVSLANNHTRNAGNQGITDTCRTLDQLGVGHAGAGTTLASATAPAWLSAGGLRVAFLAYDALEGGNWVRPGRYGAAPLTLSGVLADIKAARTAGADFVAVMPHWGGEYTTYVSPLQRRQAAAMVAAGANVILGSHSHYVGAIQTLRTPSGDPAFVVYSLGNLLFDFNYDEQTQEGVIDELTFVGTRLVQIQLNPTVMVDYSQTNLLDPTGDGKRVLDRIRAASGH